jgi:hypothetical protein
MAQFFGAGVYNGTATRYIAALLTSALVVGGLVFRVADEQGTRCESGTAPPL